MESIKSNVKPYRFTMKNEEHHQFLSAAELWSSQANIDVLISQYPDEVYDSWLKNWRSIDFQSTTRQGQAMIHYLKVALDQWNIE